MAPIKLKLSLSNAAIPPSNTPHDPPVPALTAKPSEEKQVTESAPDPSFLDNEPGPSTPRVSTTVAESAPDTPSSRPRPTKTKRKAKPLTAPRKKRPAPSTPRPSAIPRHVLSESVASPSPSNPTLPPSPSPVADYDVKSEPASPDPLSTPYSPEPEENSNTVQIRGRTGGKVTRIKKPFREMANKIMIELRRRDEYGLFSLPVEVDELPGYLEIVGGREKMMDLQTMQDRIDAGEYRRIDDLEADLKMIVEAAQKFNPEGSVPYGSAAKLLYHGLKHIERVRPIILSPSPSPTRDRSVLSGSGRETQPPEDIIPPGAYLPLEMLEFPPNSLPALAVGWNLNGGRRVYIKRELRTRERFSGRWRRWGLDGSRDIADIEDPAEVFRADRKSKPVDWLTIRRSAWWEWDGIGGSLGQPPVPFAPFPIRPALPTRGPSPLDYGVYPDIDKRRPAGATHAGYLADHVRPEKPRVLRHGEPAPVGQQWFTHYTDKLGRTSSHWLADMVGGPRGEAYRRSIKAFAGESFERYIREKYNDGVLSSPIDAVINRTIETISPNDARVRTAHERAALRYILNPQDDFELSLLFRRPDEFFRRGRIDSIGAALTLKWVASAIQRVAMAQEYTRQGNEEADLIPSSELEDAEQSSIYVDTPLGTDKYVWVGGRPVDNDTTATALTVGKVVNVKLEPLPRGRDLAAIRLELLQTAKFYALPGVKKFTKAEAARLLPEAVARLLVDKN